MKFKPSIHCFWSHGPNFSIWLNGDLQLFYFRIGLFAPAWTFCFTLAILKKEICIKGWL